MNAPPPHTHNRWHCYIMQNAVNLIKCDWLRQPKLMPSMNYNDQTSCHLASRLYCCIFVFSNTLTQNALTHTNVIQSCQTDSKRQLTACGAKKNNRKTSRSHRCPPLSRPAFLFSCYISVSIFCFEMSFPPLLHCIQSIY